MKFLLSLLLLSVSSCSQSGTPLATDDELPVPQARKGQTINIPQPTDFLALKPTSGAPSQITRNIMQDSNGNLWFATFGGLIRYDGVSFSNESKAFTDARFFAALEDRDGTLWCGTIGSGLFRYNGNTRTNVTTADGLVGDAVISIMQAENGDLWFGTTAGISRYDGKTFQNFTTNEGLPGNEAVTILQDDAGLFWIGTRQAAVTYDGTAFRKIRRTDGSTFTNVRHFIQDSRGNIWLGGNDGLWVRSGGLFTRVDTNFTGYVYEDSAGNIWTSSENGDPGNWAVTRYNAADLRRGVYRPVKVKTGEAMTFGIFEDGEGHVWVGTLDGVLRYDGTSFVKLRE